MSLPSILEQNNKITNKRLSFALLSLSFFFPCVLNLFFFSLKQQAETEIRRRVGIGNHISERKLIDELTRMGMNESIVSSHLIKYPLQLPPYTNNKFGKSDSLEQQ